MTDMAMNCDNCEHATIFSEDASGNRIVDCAANEFQLFSPAVEDYDCKRWEKRLDAEA